MINRLFYQIINAIGVFFRVLRAFFQRRIISLTSGIRRATNVSRKAASTVPKAVSQVAVAGQKPTKREDYVETQHLFISKSLIITIILAILGVGILIYFVVWPWLLSTFFTARIHIDNTKLDNYSGKVIVYYDKAREQPKFEGRLVEGLAEGPGKVFDENGMVVFSGNYAGGQYQGKGSLFDDGILIYDGNFEAGVISGTGTRYSEHGGMLYAGEFLNGEYSGQGTLYEQGRMLYRGAFAFGSFSGEGALYDADEDMTYKGSFVEGKKSGQGLEYHKSGAIKYKGGFLDGLYDERGQLYNDDGSLKYDGGFRGGQYHGDGVLNVDGSVKIEGKFEFGEPNGEIKMYKDGKIYYAGPTMGLVPHGYGTLYSLSTSDAVYRGMLKNGAVDGAWLTGLSPEDARTCFADAAVTESRSGNVGFSIVNHSLGLTMFYTLKTENQDASAIRVYWYPMGSEVFTAESWVSTLMYNFEENRPLSEELSQTGVLTPGSNILGEVPMDKARSYDVTAHIFPEETISAWRVSDAPGNTPLMAGWTSDGMRAGAGAGAGGGGGAGAGGGADGGGGGSAEVKGRTELLLEKLGMDSIGAQTRPDPSKYYGAGDPIPVVLKLTTAEDINAVLDSMADYLENAERCESLERQRSIKERQLAEERAKLERDTGDKKLVDSLTEEIAILDLQISKCTLNMEKARLFVLTMTGDVLEEIDVTLAMFVRDPQTFDIETLRNAALGGDAGLDALTVNMAILDTEIAYQELMGAVDAYNKSRQDLGVIFGDFEMGKATRSDLDAAQIASFEARSSFYSVLCGYSKSMLRLNTMSKNWLALRFGFMTDVFSKLIEEVEEEPSEEPTEENEETTESTEESTEGTTEPTETSEEAESTTEESEESTTEETADETEEASEESPSDGTTEPTTEETPDETTEESSETSSEETSEESETE